MSSGSQCNGDRLSYMGKEPQPQKPPSELECLRWDWGELYSIAEIDGEFCATRREGHNRSPVLRADTVDGLRRKIVADYATNGAPRGLDADNYSNGITT
jgi:hypothetical protein